MCNEKLLVSNIQEWNLPHLGWDWWGPYFAKVKKDVHGRDIEIHNTEFYREPLSNKETPSLFILKISLSTPTTIILLHSQKPHHNPISRVNKWGSKCLGYIRIFGKTPWFPSITKNLYFFHLLESLSCKRLKVGYG